jgi:hypothetical protein
MKAFATAVAIAILFGVGAFFTLERMQKPVETAYRTNSVRL